MDDLQEHHLTRDQYEDGVYETRDSRAPTETMFTAKDIEKETNSPRQEWRMKRAMHLQEGQWVQSYESMPSRNSQNNNEWKRRVMQIITGLADVSPYHKERTLHLLEELGSLNKYGPYRNEEVMISVLQYVMEEEDERFDRATPCGESIESPHIIESRDSIPFAETDEFEHICEEFNSSVDRIMKVYQKTKTLIEDDGDD